eukprot:SAG11_NODE_32451_length_283_cov_1.119565_1_plen_43_part_10
MIQICETVLYSFIVAGLAITLRSTGSSTNSDLPLPGYEKPYKI